jgi:hypothetical protein
MMRWKFHNKSRASDSTISGFFYCSLYNELFLVIASTMKLSTKCSSELVGGGVMIDADERHKGMNDF